VSDKGTAVITKGKLKTLEGQHLWSATLFWFPNHFPDIFTGSNMYFGKGIIFQ